MSGYRIHLVVFTVAVMLVTSGTALGAGRIHRFVFHVGTQAKTVRLPGRARNWDLITVRVRGGSRTMYAQGVNCSPTTGLCKTVALYGDGVALKFIGRGRRGYIRAVSLVPHRTVVVRYRFG